MSALLDDRLDPAERAALDAHLDACPPCADALEALDAAGRPRRRTDGPHAGVVAQGPRTRRFCDPRKIAEGGQGEVFAAHDEELGRQVALKWIKPELADRPARKAGLIREALISAEMEHPGCIPVYALGCDDDGRSFYAMRLVRDLDADAPEATLATAIARLRDETDPRARRRALRDLLGRFVVVCKTIAYAHERRGMLHCDLKPRNIILGPYGETLVLDWGVARPISRSDDPDAPGARPDDADSPAAPLPCTPSYASPEQVEGRPDRLGPASDVYGLGAILYEVLTGRPAFPAPEPSGDEATTSATLAAVRRGDFPPPRRAARRVPRGLEAVCLKAMALRPGDRYASAGDLARDVEHWLADEPVTARRDPWPARLARWVRRHTPLAIALASAALLLAVSAVLESRRRAADADAKTNFGLARNTAFALLTEVVNADLARTPQADGLRRKLAELVAAEAAAAITRWPDDPRLKRDAAKAFLLTANLHRQNGEFPEALIDYEKARKYSRELARDRPREHREAALLAQVFFEEADALAASGRHAAARASLAEARSLQESLARSHGDHPDVLRLDAYVHTDLGSFQAEVGEHGPALASFERAVLRFDAEGVRRPLDWGTFALALDLKQARFEPCTA